MSGAVHAQINYILPTDEKPVTYLTNPGSKPAQRNAEYREVEVTIRDARPTAEALDLEREGFTLNTEGSAVSDFYDSGEIEAVYSPEVERLVKQASGAAEVLVFDHTIRVADDTLRSERKVREPVHVAHNDYTPARRRSGCATCCRQTAPRRCCSTALPWCRCGGRSQARCRTCPSPSATPRASTSGTSC